MDKVVMEKRDALGILTLNRPEQMNAMDGGLLRELMKGFDALERDPAIRVVILTGAGKAFCAGADVEDFQRGGLDEMHGGTIRKIVELEKPVIAAINGHALGGGAELALMCDLIIASEQATFGFLGPKIGAVCGYALIRLGREIGRARAKELLLTCDRISPAKALEFGLINRVVPHQDLMDACFEVATKIKSLSVLSVKYTKQGINRGLDGYEFRDTVVDAMLRTEDFQEGIAAFGENRIPEFKGK